MKINFITGIIIVFLLVLYVEAEPALPAGLGVDDENIAKGPEKKRGIELPFKLYGFWDTRTGLRLQPDDHQGDWILLEDRIQLGADKFGQLIGFKVVADILIDYTDSAETHVDLNTGEGWFDLRQANIVITPVSAVDMKIGRQILTWGTGDLLFINDNFPKDWQSFFCGRDVEYLKSPSDAVKGSFFTDFVNIDLVYTPQFDPDRYITGNRISYYNSGLKRPAGESDEMLFDIPNEWFDDDELAARLYRNVNGCEVALYGYNGFWKSPGGQNMEGAAIFPRLNVWGASVRSPIAGGIGNAEAGYYDSRDDSSGTDPMIKNSEWRALVGYEHDLKSIASDFTIALQYYLEIMDDYSGYRDFLPNNIPVRDECRHVLTLRLTKMVLRQNLQLSFFSYYSPSDKDAYLRPYAGYKINDRWKVDAGANLFIGEDDYTFFGQFEKNNNIYMGVRYSF